MDDADDATVWLLFFSYLTSKLDASASRDHLI